MVAPCRCHGDRASLTPGQGQGEWPPLGSCWGYLLMQVCARPAGLHLLPALFPLGPLFTELLQMQSSHIRRLTGLYGFGHEILKISGQGKRGEVGSRGGPCATVLQL